VTRRRAPALFAAVTGGLLGALVAIGVPGFVPSAPVTPARADDLTPYAASAVTRYQVTFAARSCRSYADVAVGRPGELAGRGDGGETLGRPGHDSPYQPGQPVDVAVEEDVDAGCTDLPGWRFTIGSGYARKGRYSTVTGRLFTTPATKESTTRLDQTGRDTGGLLSGGVTVMLTDEQVGLAARRQLWVQGGTPDKPVGDGYALGALRCAADGQTPGNVQWLSFPSGTRHVFCYAYYVKGAGDGGTVTVRMRTTRPVSYPQRVPFSSGLSLAPDGGFALASSGEQVEAAFTRLPAAYRVQPHPPAGWRLAGAECAASRPDGRPARSASVVETKTGATSVTLAAGDVVVCTYSLEPPAQPPGLRLSLMSPGAGGTFGLTLDGGAKRQSLTATTDDDVTPVTAGGADLTALAPGRYTVTVAPPAAQATQWTLLGALCNGKPGVVNAMTVTVDLLPGIPVECVLRLARKAPTLRLAVVTAGGVATAAFAVVPIGGASGGWWATANTTGYGVPAPAAGDVPRDLGFGTYLITAVAPRSTLSTGWRLGALRCDPGNAAPAGGATVRVALTPDGPDPVCTATYQAEPTTRMQVTLRATGAPTARQDAAIVEVSCVDGSGGRLVLSADAGERAELPEPLAFLEPAACVIAQPASGVGRTGTVRTSAVREPSTGGGPVELPLQLDVARDVTEYTIAVTNDFSDPLTVASSASFLDELRAGPFIAAGIGMFGFGGLIFLRLVLRRRVA
jgi:hypothetical protein